MSSSWSCSRLLPTQWHKREFLWMSPGFCPAAQQLTPQSLKSIKCHDKPTLASRMSHHCLKAEMRKSAECWTEPTKECRVFSLVSSLRLRATQRSHKFQPLWKRTLWAFPLWAVFVFPTLALIHVAAELFISSTDRSAGVFLVCSPSHSGWMSRLWSTSRQLPKKIHLKAVSILFYTHAHHIDIATSPFPLFL